MNAGDEDDEDRFEISTDPALRPAAIEHAAGLIGDLYAIDVALDGNRDVPRDEYMRMLLEHDNPLLCATEYGSRDYSFRWLFTEADMPEILERADVMIRNWTAAGEQWGVSGE